MINQIFVNLPVKDLNRSIDFFTQLGFSFNPQFTDENATCMIIGENIYAMLLVEKYFTSFTNKEISDTSKSCETILALSTDSKKSVDDYINKAKEAGGSIPNEGQDLGFMYSKSFLDPDGHLWEVLYMDMEAIPQGSEKNAVGA